MVFHQFLEFQLKNPENFGVIEFDENKNIINIFEKPDYAKSNFIVSGLYFYTNDVVKYAKKVKTK